MKEYKAYLSFGFRFCSLCLIPLLVILLGNIVGLTGIMVAESVMTLIIAIEAFVDNFGFGGMLYGNRVGNHLFHSSFYGERFMKRLILEDIGLRVGKIIAMVVISGITEILLYGFNPNLVLAGFITLFVTQLCICIARHFLSLQLQALSIIVAGALSVALFWGVTGFLQDYFIVCTVIMALLSIGVSVFTFFHEVNCYKRGFEDK